jgi:dTDP-4-dehydrorhamnose 3,5-epimerase
VKIIPTEIPSISIVQLDVYGDARGFFVERFQLERFREFGLPTEIVQINHSRSQPGVLRGMHYQHTPAQGKLVGVTRGRIWDVAVDIRPYSRTFGQAVWAELSDENGRMLWIPAGFAHGFCVLGEESVDVVYQTDAAYNPEGEVGIAWDDPELAIPWPMSRPIVSVRDRGLPSFAAYRKAPSFATYREAAPHRELLQASRSGLDGLVKMQG